MNKCLFDEYKDYCGNGDCVYGTDGVRCDCDEGYENQDENKKDDPRLPGRLPCIESGNPNNIVQVNVNYV